jgi:VanZ family protein
MIRKLFIISLIWALLILIICAIPGGSLPQSRFFAIPYFDKIIHAALYFPLAFFLCAEFDLTKKTLFQLSGPLLTMLIIAFYGGMIEVLQEKLFINRSADIMDFFSDLVGGLAGLTIYYLFFRPFFQKFLEKK